MCGRRGAIERGPGEDVAYRVIAAHTKPDHATIARFVERHEQAVAGLFGAVLGLCAQAGLAKVGIVAIDGTKVQANASRDATRDYEQIAKEILEVAKAVDAAEDELYGEARGDEPAARAGQRPGSARSGCAPGSRQPSMTSAQPTRDRSRAHAKRLKEAKRRLEEQLWTECRANAAYEDYRARGVMKNGRRSARRPSLTAAGEFAGQDQCDRSDSRLVKGMRGGCRATTPKRRTMTSRSSSRPRSRLTRPTSATSNRSSNAARNELQAVGVADTPDVIRC